MLRLEGTWGAVGGNMGLGGVGVGGGCGARIMAFGCGGGPMMLHIM